MAIELAAAQQTRLLFQRVIAESATANLAFAWVNTTEAQQKR